MRKRYFPPGTDRPQFEVPAPRPFRAARWLPGAHAQTVGARFLRGVPREELSVERIELPDGDFIDLEEMPHPYSPDAPVVLILHGLEGSARANYVSTMAREIMLQGARPVRLNFRACSGEMNRLPRFYHAGDTDDLHFVISVVRERFPEAPLGAVGISLGGSILLKYLGERGSGGSALDCAVAVSVPFDLVAGTHRMEEIGMSRVYTQYFVWKLRAKVRAKRNLLEELCAVEQGMAARTIREFDDAITAPLHGFDDAWEYYREASSTPWLSEIRTPTLILHALDDPFLPAEAVPIEAIRANPWLSEGIVPEGGHVGFVSGSPIRPSFWAEREAAHFLERCFDAGSGAFSQSDRSATF